MMMVMPMNDAEGPQMLFEGCGDSNAPQLPLWQEEGESEDHRQYILHYHTMKCPQFANGYCARQKGPRSSQQCFCYHFESQQRRRLVDVLTGRLRYWDVMCNYVVEGEYCPHGDMCHFAHTREEISYHAAKYKTKLCNDTECRGEEVCCFAHGERELRHGASSRYSYRSLVGDAPKMNMQWPVGVPASWVDASACSGEGGEPRPGSRCGGGASTVLFNPEVYKTRFCAAYPNVASCRRGEACAFAHGREEIRMPLLTVEEEEQRQSALTNEFFTHRFKIRWCPVGVQHDWQTCVYAHNYQDARRHPGLGYGPRPCPYWKRQETSLEYSQRCPLGVRCPYSHGAKEQLYHPSYFKTVVCQDSRGDACPRGKLCAFWHRRSQQRSRAAARGAGAEQFSYKLPIVEDKVQASLQADFLTPPFKILNSLQENPQMMEQMNYWTPQLCGYHGPGTPATQTTAADSDEAASAGSVSGGSDKLPAIQDEDACGADGPGVVPESMVAQQWGAQMWPAEDCYQVPMAGAAPQIMCYMQMPFGAFPMEGGGVPVAGMEGGWIAGVHPALPDAPAQATQEPGYALNAYSSEDEENFFSSIPTTCSGEGDVAAIAAALASPKMPSRNGFIHFQEELEIDSPHVRRRPRANSH